MYKQTLICLFDEERNMGNAQRKGERHLHSKKEKQSKLSKDLDIIAVLAKSLSDENRLRILLCVGNGKKSVSRIVEELDLSQPLVSHHLKELKRTLLVKVEREGPFIYYEMADKRILNILKELDLLGTDLLTQRKNF
jgi:DNA-binding transcriptional ArsR family regulator